MASHPNLPMKSHNAGAVWWGMAIAAFFFIGALNNTYEQEKDGVSRAGNIYGCWALGIGSTYISYRLASKE